MCYTLPWDSSLMQHLPTSWQPAWQLSWSLQCLLSFDIEGKFVGWCMDVRAYPEIVPLSALIACNAMNWPGGDALSFSHKFHHWLMLFTLGQYIVNVQWSITGDGYLTIFIFGICGLKGVYWVFDAVMQWPCCRHHLIHLLTLVHSQQKLS